MTSNLAFNASEKLLPFFEKELSFAIKTLDLQINNEFTDFIVNKTKKPQGVERI